MQNVFLINEIISMMGGENLENFFMIMLNLCFKNNSFQKQKIDTQE